MARRGAAAALRDARAGGGVRAPARRGGAARRQLQPPPITPRPRWPSTGSRSPSGSTATCPAAAQSLWGRYVWAADGLASSDSTPTGSAPSTSSTSTSRSTPGADERYHVRGGNDQLVARARRRAPGRHDPSSTARSRRCSSAPTAATDCGSAASPAEVVADRVVLAIPFTTLRRVDLERAGLSARKRALHRRARHGDEREGADAVRAPAAANTAGGTATCTPTTPSWSPGRAPSASPGGAAS